MELVADWVKAMPTTTILVASGLIYLFVMYGFMRSLVAQLGYQRNWLREGRRRYFAILSVAVAGALNTIVLIGMNESDEFSSETAVRVTLCSVLVDAIIAVFLFAVMVFLIRRRRNRSVYS